jgi:hypothetical protein
MRTYPVFNLLAHRSFGVGVITGTQDSDEDLCFMYLTGFPVNYIDRLSGIVDKHFLACPVLMAHDYIQPGSPVPIIMAVPAVLVAVRVSFFIFLPQQVQCDVFARL